jgi:hypothetical protein
MKKQIIKINTDPELPLVKIGDIVQFDELPPVKVVAHTECERCCFFNYPDELYVCNYQQPLAYCEHLKSKLYNGIMFKEIKAK